MSDIHLRPSFLVCTEAAIGIIGMLVGADWARRGWPWISYWIGAASMGTIVVALADYCEQLRSFRAGDDGR